MLKDMQYKDKYANYKKYETEEEIIIEMDGKTIAEAVEEQLEFGKTFGYKMYSRALAKGVHKRIKDLYTGRESKQRLAEAERRILCEIERNY